MSVNLLLCEGNDSSHDAIVLRKILVNIQVKAMGGKSGMGERIKARRELLGDKKVAGILDGDFLAAWQPPQGKPRSWEINNGGISISLGWRWERKEIGNYLLDPKVVKNALENEALDTEQYRVALEQARDRIAVYQAARIALSANRVKIKPLPSQFGKERGKHKHLFPDSFDEQSCRDGIVNTVSESTHTNLVSEENVLNSFERYIHECQPGGERYSNYLAAFSGKDLGGGDERMA